jgi:hypothetical protein
VTENEKNLTAKATYCMDDFSPASGGNVPQLLCHSKRPAASNHRLTTDILKTNADGGQWICTEIPMFSAINEQARPLITVWLQVRVLPGPPIFQWVVGRYYSPRR